MLSRMCTWGGMVGWKGAVPKSSHHRGLARCQEKGKKEWSVGAPAARSCKHTMSQWGGGVWTRLVVGYTWTWVVVRLPHRVSAHGIEELVNARRERGQMQKFKGGELAAQFPPQRCGPAPPPEVGVAGGAAHVDVNDLGGGGGSRDAAQPTTSSSPSAPERYVASSN